MSVLLSCIVADWVEGAKVSLVLMPSRKPCHTCCCLLTNFNNYEKGKEAKMRTGQRSEQVVREAFDLAASRKKGEGKALCTRHSLDFRPNVLWGLDLFDVHQCLGPDCLHVLDIGLFEWIVKFIFEEMDQTLTTGSAVKVKTEITKRLASIPYFPRLVRFPNGIEKVAILKKGKFQGAEYRNIMKQLVAVVFDLVPLPTLQALTTFLDLYKVAKLPRHDNRTLHRLQSSTKELFSKMEHFKKYSSSELRFPKLHVTVHIERFIKMFGRLGNLDTETFETFHHLKAQIPYENTNKQTGTVTKQVIPLFPKTMTTTTKGRFLPSSYPCQ